MGGIRVLKKLGIRPRVYHINEGHSAFLLFERIGALMTEEGLSFDEASEIVRGNTVFKPTPRWRPATKGSARS